MTIEERIAWAKKQRNIAYKKDSVQGIVYWDGYLAALKAVKDEGAIIVNNFGNGKQIKNEGHITINVGKGK